MIPKTNNNEEIQFEVLGKIREVHEYDSDLNDRIMLIAIFKNYRTGGGLRLSEFGYNLCNEYKLYSFTPIPLKKEDKNSFVYTSLDRICTSPYYIEGNTLYLSDDVVLTQLTFYCDDLRKTFKSFQ